MQTGFCQGNSLETKLIREEDFEKLPQLVPGLLLSYFKMVSVGECTVEECDSDPDIVNQKVGEQLGFYLITDSDEKMRQDLHTLVDKFCDAQESAKDKTDG